MDVRGLRAGLYMATGIADEFAVHLVKAWLGTGLEHFHPRAVGTRGSCQDGAGGQSRYRQSQENTHDAIDAGVLEADSG